MSDASSSQEGIIEQAEGSAPANDLDIDAEEQRDDEIDDEAPTLRRPPVLDEEDRWFGRETFTSAAVFAIGIATLAYAATAGSAPYPQRALASGASASAEVAR